MMKRHLVVSVAIFPVVLLMLVVSMVSQVFAGIEYTITNSSTINMKVDPLSKAESASAYYDYDTVYYASGNPDFGTVSNTGFFWLYEDTTNGNISLGMIFDTPNEDSGGSLDMSISGVPASGFVEVEDDPSTSPWPNIVTTTGGNWTWTKWTDGGVIGGIDGSWDITITF